MKLLQTGKLQVYSKECHEFDELWGKPLQTYNIPEGSFCSNYCEAHQLRSNDPYWFNCSNSMMPKVTYFTSNGINNSTECLVETRYGKNNEENMRCINKIVNHINDLKSSLIKIIYISHGWTMGDPDDFVDMKDAL